ncbi:MAG: NUDIX domain-containing protein [Spirochaetales bacterium]
MECNNPLYQKQGIHTVNAIFTVQKGVLKLILIKRINNPFKDMWALVSGAIYNNETFEDGTAREIFEKTGLKNLNTKMFGLFSALDRSPDMRMIGVGNISVIDSKKVELENHALASTNCDWFDVKKMPGKLAFDHDMIFQKALEYLKAQIYKTDIVKSLLPSEFTMPMLHSIYEAVLEKKIDRRNFSKKILNLNLVKDLHKMENDVNKKPAKLYAFKKDTGIQDIY